MQREISDKVTLGDTLNPYEDARRSTAIDRTASNYNDAREKVQKIRNLIGTGRYDADLAKYTPGLLELAFQSMLEEIDTKEKTAHPSYKDMEQSYFQILLTENYYVNPNGIRICFPIKIKKATNKAADIDNDVITVNNFWGHRVKEVSVTKHGSDKELPPTFSPCEVYQYADSMLKHLPKDALKTIEKTHFYSKQTVYYADVGIDRRIDNGDGVNVTGLNTTAAATKKAAYAKDLNIDDRITKFRNQLKNEYVYRIPLRYFTDIGKINFPTKIDYRIQLFLEADMKRLFESRKLLATGTALPSPNVQIIFTKALYIQ